jgi:DNA-binding helix-hairpin-helix protein with protein kinase domain
MQAACVVQEMVGEGGQAEVYRARVGNSHYALKWYLPHYLSADPRVWERLKQAIDTGSPSERFLWPFDLVSHPRSNTLGGYLMPLKPANFISLVDLLRRQVEPSFRSLARVGFNLADSFFRLHTAGLCYRDINFGNVFFEPEAGDIRIGDTDNVDVNRRPGGIMGTWGFMAPEVGRRQADPSAMTDRYSLAVLLFYIFMLGHPLRGRRENNMSYDASDPDGSRRLCADDPVFVFDPQNDTNRPVRGVHDAILNFWPIYPESLQALFMRSFTAGLGDPDARVMENEWRKEMCCLADSVFLCANCHAENFYDAERMRRKAGIVPCWSCQKPIPLPARMRVCSPHHPVLVVLSPGVQVFPHHLDGSSYDFSAPAAEVVAPPLALRNMSSHSWTTRLAGNSSLIETRPGQTLVLATNCRINFGKAEGEVKVT